MNEINKPEIKLTQPVAKNTPVESKVDAKPQEEVKAKDYKEAAAAPGAEAAGRAMVMINKSGKLDNIESDVQKIIDNPKLVEQSDALFNAAEKAGVPYPQAASFATSELG